MRTDRRTDKTKRILAFQEYTKPL